MDKSKAMSYKTKAQKEAIGKNVNDNLTALILAFGSYILEKRVKSKLFGWLFRQSKITPDEFKEFMTIINKK